MRTGGGSARERDKGEETPVACGSSEYEGESEREIEEEEGIGRDG